MYRTRKHLQMCQSWLCCLVPAVNCICLYLNQRFSHFHAQIFPALMRRCTLQPSLRTELLTAACRTGWSAPFVPTVLTTYTVTATVVTPTVHSGSSLKMIWRRAEKTGCPMMMNCLILFQTRGGCLRFSLAVIGNRRCQKLRCDSL